MLGQRPGEVTLIRKAGVGGYLGDRPVGAPQQPPRIIQPDDDRILLQRDAHRLLEHPADILLRKRIFAGQLVDARDLLPMVVELADQRQDGFVYETVVAIAV